MITLGPNTIVFLRSGLKQDNGDPYAVLHKLEFDGTLSFDNHLVAIEEATAEDCYDSFEVMMASSSITMYHHCVMVIEGKFWRWGVTWLDIKEYPMAKYRDPETVDYPIIWWVE